MYRNCPLIIRFILKCDIKESVLMFGMLRMSFSGILVLWFLHSCFKFLGCFQKEKQLHLQLVCVCVCVCVCDYPILVHQDLAKYEGWNFNSGNYLFTTDTK